MKYIYVADNTSEIYMEFQAGIHRQIKFLIGNFIVGDFTILKCRVNRQVEKTLRGLKHENLVISATWNQSCHKSNPGNIT